MHETAASVDGSTGIAIIESWYMHGVQGHLCLRGCSCMHCIPVSPSQSLTFKLSNALLGYAQVAVADKDVLMYRQELACQFLFCKVVLSESVHVSPSASTFIPPRQLLCSRCIALAHRGQVWKGSES